MPAIFFTCPFPTLLWSRFPPLVESNSFLFLLFKQLFSFSSAALLVKNARFFPDNRRRALVRKTMIFFYSEVDETFFFLSLILVLRIVLLFLKSVVDFPPWSLSVLTEFLT